jgi:P-type conjugative transfer protein TrbJ
LNVKQFDTERNAIAQIQGMSGSSEGALQAVQAGNMIASQTVDQLQKMRQMLATQTLAPSRMPRKKSAWTC